MIFRFHVGRCWVLAAALLAFGTQAEASLLFDFSFDDTFDETLTPPIVGTGTLTLATDPGDGTFLYTALAPTYTFSFPSLGATFTEADIASDPSKVRMIISTTPQGRRLQFSDDGSGNGGGGPHGGSLDLDNGSGFLTFEPSYFGAGLVLYQAASAAGGVGGTYGQFVVPEPTGLVLMGIGLVGLVGLVGLAGRRRRSAAA